MNTPLQGTVRPCGPARLNSIDGVPGAPAASAASAASVIHGGPDGGPPIRFDFSTNAHPLGPSPEVLAAVMAADRRRYPDPAYTALRGRLGRWHDLEPDRVLPAAGGAEAIRRLTLAAMLAGVTRVHVPSPGFGDYAAAALALGLEARGYASIDDLLGQLAGTSTSTSTSTDAGIRPDAHPGAHATGLGHSLVWVCDPCNPTGATLTVDDWSRLASATARHGASLAIDQAYEPLRLDGRCALPDAVAQRAWRLVCPNKALGLTGIRGAYLLAPLGAAWLGRVRDLAASWVLSAEGQAMLEVWSTPATQAALAASLPVLADWRDAQIRQLAAAGWRQPTGGVANFWLARPPCDDNALPPLLRRLRAAGIKLRDATSFGLPGWVRIAALAPEAQDALDRALRQDGMTDPLPR